MQEAVCSSNGITTEQEKINTSHVFHIDENGTDFAEPPFLNT